MPVIEKNRHMPISSGRIRLQNSGWIRADCKGVVDLAEQRLVGSRGSSTNITQNCWRRGMTISVVEIEVPNAMGVTVNEETLSVDLNDGRTVSVPLMCFPRLIHAAPEERNNWRLIGKGQGIHWEDIDEDISVEGLLAGKSSGEARLPSRSG
jgi:hypothetical protein